MLTLDLEKFRRLVRTFSLDGYGSKIITEMMSNLDPIQKKKILVITDRRQAIKTACRLANANDIVLVAGKGHEKYQEINGEKFPFDDLEELKQSLNIIIQ